LVYFILWFSLLVYCIRYWFVMRLNYFVSLTIKTHKYDIKPTISTPILAALEEPQLLNVGTAVGRLLPIDRHLQALMAHQMRSVLKLLCWSSLKCVLVYVYGYYTVLSA